MDMRASHTAVVERDIEWTGSFATEPYEVSWAAEALFFIRLLDAQSLDEPFCLHVQISPDGMRWCDEGTTFPLDPTAELSWCRVSHFGGWLRLRGELAEGQSARVIAYLHLKE